MYTINKESIQAIVQKAYEEGRLLAQNVDPTKSLEYFYRRGDIGCAIGVALQQEVADSLSQDSQLKLNSVRIDYDDWCEELQHLHDRWVNTEDLRTLEEQSNYYTEAAEAAFKAHLYS